MTNKGLKRREKVLIFIATVMGLVTLTYTYLISPMFIELGEKQEHLESLRLERFQLSIKLDNEEIYISSAAKAYAGYQAIEEKYPELIPSNEIDKILTGLSMEFDFKPMSLSLPEPVPFTRGIERGLSPVFSTVSASMTIQGSYEDLIMLIDEVNRNYDYIRISAVRYSRPRILRNATDTPDVAITFLVTMMNPVEV